MTLFRLSNSAILIALMLTSICYADEIDFDRDIRTILANKCYACHGPDENARQAELRLDVKEEVFASRETPVVTARDLSKSELFARISSDDPDYRMPPADSSRPALTENEIKLVGEWIEQGAEWGTHWAYIPPTKVDPPKVDGNVKNEIDQFVISTINKRNLTPANEADRVTLIRRLSFDLLGLPPSQSDVEQFLNDGKEGAYQRLVDRLLQSEHFGERMAMYWLDVVRYADSNGYHSDEARLISAYRDYVIDVFNNNVPYDEFVVEQLAGDLLPEATNQQKIASGFNMLLQTTNEGGAQAKEYLAKYSADRVRNTSSIFLGSTLGCAECHNHKFDPFTTKDFYSFAAFFADIKQKGVGNPEAYPIYDEESRQQLVLLDVEIEELSSNYEARQKTLEAEALLLHFEANLPGLTTELLSILKIPADNRSDEQTHKINDYFQSNSAELKQIQASLDKAKAKRNSVIDRLPKTLMTVSTEPMVIRVLPRGNWLDDSGPEVRPQVPLFLNPLDVRDRRANRLDLARWIVDPHNPLTARTFVNRLWKICFGQGLATPLDDLGAQGTRPTHPKLLDWLAVEFMESGWDVKHMVRLIVNSATYRQTSTVSAEVRSKDAYNKSFARQARFRLDAEMVRDNALAIGGLLSSKIGGPSVKPYQPEGYWEHMNFPVRRWKTDDGEDLYRRGLYTWWQRMFLHPSLLAFDAPSREECTVERPRSNTPQQSLVLLNDPTYVEAARSFAERILKNGGDSIEDRIYWAYREALSRNASEKEVSTIKQLVTRHLENYKSDPESAAKLLAVGRKPVPDYMDKSILAAWTSVARVILNLHETITRR